MTQWQPIETAPRDGTQVLAWFDHLKRPVVAYHRNNRHGFGWAAYVERSANSLGIQAAPRCWMPLPPPPEGSTP